jgi:hypothetical protein
VIVGARARRSARRRASRPRSRRARSRRRRSPRSIGGSPSAIWSPQARKYNYASWVDLKTGKLVLKTNAPRAVRRRSQGYTGAIEQQDEAVRDTFSRRADTSPFWGGSSIKSGGGVCSSGFIVQRGGQRFMVTAGHRFAVGANAHDRRQPVRGQRHAARPVPPVAVPVLRHTDSSNVFIRGLNVASGATTSFAEKWSRISSNLGVSIVT